MSKVRDLTIDEAKALPLDPFALLTMTYTQDGFEELKNDISRNGQLVAILLRNGKVLDGRHRLRACIELEVPVAYEELGDIDDEEALDIVISNSLSKATNTDAAKVEAYLMCKAKGIRNKDMPEKFSRLNINYVRKLSFIEKQNSKYLTAILRQNQIRLHNKEFDKIEDYGTINGVWRVLKGNQKMENTVVEVVPEPASREDYETDLESYFNNAAAEAEYWDLYKLGKESGVNLHPDSPVGKKIAGLVKWKHKLEH